MTDGEAAVTNGEAALRLHPDAGIRALAALRDKNLSPVGHDLGFQELAAECLSNPAVPPPNLLDAISSKRGNLLLDTTFK